MLLNNGRLHLIYPREPRMRKVIEIHIVGSIPFFAFQAIAARQSPVDFTRHSLGTHRYALSAVIKCGYADIMSAFPVIDENCTRWHNTSIIRSSNLRTMCGGGQLVSIGFSVTKRPKPVTDDQVSAEATVDISHHPSKEFSMGRTVFQIFRGNVKMYHLVDYDILPCLLGQVEQCAETYLEISVPLFPQSSYSLVAQLSDVCSGAGKHNGYFRQRAPETQLIEMGKLLPSVWNGDYHLQSAQIRYAMQVL